jgi:hypothetical protein
VVFFLWKRPKEVLGFGIKKGTSSDSCAISYLQEGAQWKTAGNPVEVTTSKNSIGIGDYLMAGWATKIKDGPYQHKNR